MKHTLPHSRHSREGGNPFSGMHQSKMDSRLRGNDGQRKWRFILEGAVQLHDCWDENPNIAALDIESLVQA
jgi:hypothetical protein